MFNSEVRSIWLFFYLIFLDEEIATSIASKAVDLFFESMKKNPQVAPSVTLVKVTENILKKNEVNLARKVGLIEIPKNLSTWLALQKQIGFEELLPLIWSQILKIPIKEISEATQLSEGTVTYRISRGVEVLSKIMSAPEKLEVNS